MDLVHDRGPMDSVHESGPWTRSKEGVHWPLVHVLSSPKNKCSYHNVSARNVFRYLHSIFMFTAFLLIFVFAPLVLFFGSLVFHCPRSFVVRVSSRQFFVSCAWSSLQFNVWVFARPSISSLSRYRLVSISFVSFAFLDCLIAFVQFVGCFILTLYLFNCYFSVPLYFTSVHLLPFTSCRSSRIKFVC